MNAKVIYDNFENYQDKLKTILTLVSGNIKFTINLKEDSNMSKYGPKKLDKVDIQTTELAIHPHPDGDHLINIIDDNKTDIDDNYTVTFISNTPNIEFYLSDIISITAYTDIVVD